MSMLLQVSMRQFHQHKNTQLGTDLIVTIHLETMHQVYAIFDLQICYHHNKHHGHGNRHHYQVIRCSILRQFCQSEVLLDL